MIRMEVKDLKVGEHVTPLMGPFKESKLAVLKVDMDAGVYNGLITVQLPDGRIEKFAGEEVHKSTV